MAGRSRCVACDRVLRPHHLVPLFSWIALKGRCAFCQHRIHPVYPIVELLGGALTLLHVFLSFYWMDPFSMTGFGIQLFFLYGLLALAVFDWRWKILPLEIMVGFGVLLGAAQAFSQERSLYSVLMGVVIGGAFLGVQWLISKGKWIGGGDPILGAAIGAMLGWPQVAISLYFTYMIGGVVFLGYWISGRWSRSKRIAFAPLLALGAACTVWFGPALEAWLRTVFV